MSDEFKKIVSSNLDSAAFDAESRSITVRFQNGAAYRYPQCDLKLWKDFQKTFDGKQGRSAGKYLNAHLRPKAYEKL